MREEEVSERGERGEEKRKKQKTRRTIGRLPSLREERLQLR